MVSLGLAVITKNEEKNIGRCLDSVPFASEIVVVDSESTDRTKEVAEAHGARVIIKPWAGYAKQKQFALEQLKTDWILCLDADEWLEKPCAEEIVRLLEQGPNAVAYKIPRYLSFLGKVLRHGKGVDHPIRLLKRGSGRYSERAIHEEILVDGTVATLNHGMIHHSSESVSNRIAKIERDTDAELQYDAGHAISFNTLVIQPARYFASYVLKKGGWKDGPAGILLTGLFSYQLFLQQMKYRANRKRRNVENPSRGR